MVTRRARLVMTLLWFMVILACASVSGKLLGVAEQPNGATSVDSSITTWMIAHRTHGLTAVARLLSTLGSQKILLPVTAILTLVLIGRRRFVLAGLLGLAWAGAIGLYSLTKYFVHRMRPPTGIWLAKVTGTSFPSGH